MRSRLLLPCALLVAALFALQGASAEKEEQANASKDPGAGRPEVEAAALAHQLAAYGEEHDSAEALVTAASILARNLPRAESKEKKSEGEGAMGGEKSGERITDAEQMLARARAMAPDDEAVEALATRVEQRLAAAKGAVGGPGIHCDRVLAGYTDTYTNQWTFRGGEPAEMIVEGDGDTDLDCWVYDENGNLISSDTDLTDLCVMAWQPRWTGPFSLKVENFGSVWNGYCILWN